MRGKKNKIKMSPGDLIYHIIVIPIFILLALTCIYPFWYLLICTVSESSQIDLGNVLIWPVGFHLNNYVRVFREPGLLQAALVTVARVVIGTTVNTMCAAYVAYFFTKQNMWRRKVWYRIIIITMYFSAGLIPNYLHWKMLGLLNTFWIYIIPGIYSVYHMILIKTSIEAMPRELEESAVIDGAGYMRRFLKIVLPLQTPILATIALFSGVGHWNDYLRTRLYVTNPRLFTLQFKLYEILEQTKAAFSKFREMETGTQFTANITPTGVRLTLTAVIVIPIMCVYPLIQKYYVKGIMVGAIKG